jgi:SAM-dependent methyltransferase
MEYVTMKEQFVSLINAQQLINATISQPRMKSNELKRIKLKPIELRGEYHIQIEYQYERILKHENVRLADFEERFNAIVDDFRQIQAEFTNQKVHIQISKKNKVLWKSDQQQSTKQVNLSHNRKKQYLLDPDKPYPFLIRLGVQTEDGKVRKQKFDKFKQINRFLEFIDDSLKHLPQNRQIKILDFGSGKSYLTFALYHYLKVEKGYDLAVTGLDLKKEVIEECNRIARDLQYEQLQFLVGDINDFNDEQQIDMVVTLHACDVATDMALARAVRWGAKVILSVPCCQHELNRQLEAPQLDVMINHGIIRERFAALATDSIRAQILELVGYEAQILEFIDMENTPKNLLIRAYYTGKEASSEKRAEYDAFVSFLNATPFLQKELL